MKTWVTPELENLDVNATANGQTPAGYETLAIYNEQPSTTKPENNKS